MAGLRGETRQGQRQGRGGVRLRGRGQLAGHPADCSRRRTTGASLKTPQVGATAIIQLPVRVQRCCCRLTVSAITRDTAMAMYITPENIASIVSARASGESGTMSLRPTPARTPKLRNSRPITVHGSGGQDTPEK